jgi:CheY-like chemotaxis protein
VQTPTWEPSKKLHTNPLSPDSIPSPGKAKLGRTSSRASCNNLLGQTCTPHPAFMPLILVVDNDAEVRQFLKFVLERAGHKVLEARNGKEAIPICRIGVDLVITALFMPLQDGYETIEELKKEYTALRIVAMSEGFRDFHKGALLGMAIALDAKASMQKPLSAHVVLETVQKVLAAQT